MTAQFEDPHYHPFGKETPAMSTRPSNRHVMGWLLAVAAAGAIVVPALSLIAQDRAAATAQPAAARQQENRPGAGPGQPLQEQDISLAQAHQVLEAAIKKAEQINTKMDIAVVDAGGNLKAFARMDGAWIGSIDIAQKKARTARYFDMPTGEIGKLSQPGGPLYNIEHSNGGLITFPGGVPLKTADGKVIGAVGVSGSTVENDHTVAAAGAAAIGGGR
jgi:uncharacterized protein GlcG (DUF336 family)